MRRHQIQAVALILMWIGAVEVVASFLVHYWFEYNIPYTSLFFLALMLGVVTYLVTRIV
ncbi:hypothetical protein JZ785_08690 [Alicyclobacillus curvatus]|nr:hypothetical protein JZ785_08690 [Alicyclobacillus curvatus]